MGATSETSGQLALRDPDTRLMIGVRDDEAGAFESLVEKYQQRLLAVLHHVVGSASDAEDIAQEVFLRIYRARKKYRARAKFSTWLFTIAHNLAMNHLRRRQRRPAFCLRTSDSTSMGIGRAAQAVPAPDSGPTRKLQRKELAEFVRRAIDGLNERQRVAVLLNKFEDMNYAEIAAVMNLSTKAVKSLLNRARVNLREALKDYVYMDGQPVPAPPAEAED